MSEAGLRFGVASPRDYILNVFAFVLRRVDPQPQVFDLNIYPNIR